MSFWVAGSEMESRVQERAYVLVTLTWGREGKGTELREKQLHSDPVSEEALVNSKDKS